MIKKLIGWRTLWIVLGILNVQSSISQNNSSANYNIDSLAQFMDSSNTTLYHRTRAVIVTDKRAVRTPEEEEAYQKLRRKVIKLYPYALLAKKVYDQSTQTMNSLESNSEKHKFMKAKEEELRNRFENEIKGLYTTDGPVLVKLIHRETGKTTFDILKEVKGGFKCFFYQIAAKKYGYSLKETYDPEKDVDIENMVQLLKSENQLPIFIE